MEHAYVERYMPYEGWYGKQPVKTHRLQRLAHLLRLIGGPNRWRVIIVIEEEA